MLVRLSNVWGKKQQHCSDACLCYVSFFFLFFFFLRKSIHVFRSIWMFDNPKLETAMIFFSSRYILFREKKMNKKRDAQMLRNADQTRLS